VKIFIDPQAAAVIDKANQPRVISPRQCRLWLLGRGITLSSVDAAIDSIADQAVREAVRVEWEYSTELYRDNSNLLHLAAALGLDEAAVDQAFIEASQL
jgi:hypothetical protein